MVPPKENTQKKTSSKSKKIKKLHTVTFFDEWCKSCGICSALCPQKIIKTDKQHQPFVEDMDSCKGCRFCEIHCPDFAIIIKEKDTSRRNNND